MHITITEKQRGLRFRNGKLKDVLGAGSYHVLHKNTHIEVLRIADPLRSEYCNAETLLALPALAEQLTVLEVPDAHIALHMIDGRWAGQYAAGRYLFWNAAGKHTFQMFDLTEPEVPADFPRHVLPHISTSLLTTVSVPAHHKARLYFDRRFIRLLDAGTYYFWRPYVKIETELVDTRLMQLDLTGQEMLTLDKVAVRINFVCSYRITDYIQIASQIDDYAQQLHITAQLALRDFVGRQRLDTLLESKAEMTTYVHQALKSKEQSLFLEIVESGIKDIILPGEIREIMNTVLIAEKRAQANVITRREEVASTRSLLNTAKLMDENQTLYKLKELEYLEHICENVGSIHLNGSGDVLAQLATLLHGDTKHSAS